MIVEITALFWYNEQMETREKDVRELQALLVKKEDENAALRRQVDWLTQQLRLMQGQRFGASSEKTQTILGQMDQISLFNEAEAEAGGNKPEPELEQVTYRRRKRKGKREADLSGLPVERIVHELPEDERVCPACGEPLHACGHEVLRRELVCIPAQYKVVEHVQTAYSCRHCERASDHVPMKKSEVSCIYCFLFTFNNYLNILLCMINTIFVKNNYICTRLP